MVWRQMRGGRLAARWSSEKANTQTETESARLNRFAADQQVSLVCRPTGLPAGPHWRLQPQPTTTTTTTSAVHVDSASRAQMRPPNGSSSRAGGQSGWRPFRDEPALRPLAAGCSRPSGSWTCEISWRPQAAGPAARNGARQLALEPTTFLDEASRLERAPSRRPRKSSVRALLELAKGASGPVWAAGSERAPGICEPGRRQPHVRPARSRANAIVAFSAEPHKAS